MKEKRENHWGREREVLIDKKKDFGINEFILMRKVLWSWFQTLILQKKRNLNHGSRRFFLFDIVNRVNEVFKICFRYFWVKIS